ncbi:MAG TPA: hypothetical protein PLO37_09530 [Candidatus Hydrogenedentes bacterium]|nr:hypothetical protein [Candidatus Hydrogenedentota bacterium]HPG67072.1 hypothetical protein [Candidatus Hydrogenedentota bacterium]
MERQTLRHEELTAYERDVDMLSRHRELVGPAVVTLAQRELVFLPSESEERPLALVAN